MIQSNTQLEEAYKRMLLEDADSQRSATDRARRNQSKQNLSLVKQQRKCDVARLDSQIAAIGENSHQEFDEGTLPILPELLKEIRLLRVAAQENGKLLRAILDNL